MYIYQYLQSDLPIRYLMILKYCIELCDCRATNSQVKLSIQYKVYVRIHLLHEQRAICYTHDTRT